MSVTFGRSETLDLICDADLIESIEKLPGVIRCLAHIRSHYGQSACTIYYNKLQTSQGQLEKQIALLDMAQTDERIKC